MTSTHTPQNSYSKEELLACGRGEIFGAGNAQLPLPNMLMMDRITTINKDGGKHGKGEIIAEFDIHPDLWFFACHFQGDPVMPGCLGLDAMWQLVGFYLAWRPSPADPQKNHLPHPHQTPHHAPAHPWHRRCDR